MKKVLCWTAVHLLTGLFWLSPVVVQAQSVCGDFDGCDQVILKVRGTVQDNLGSPLLGVVVTGVENRRRDVNAIDFFSHCGGDLHLPVEGTTSSSTSAASPNPGSYELLFIVCADDRNDFAADFDVCISAPGYQPVCMTATFDDNSDREEMNFTLAPTGKTGGSEVAVSSEKGLPAGDCGDYDDCNMVILKVRGIVRDAGMNPINNAQVTAVLTNSSDVNAILFYDHCGDGFHALKEAKVGVSNSGDSTTPGFYELLFAVCGEDNNDVLPDEFDVDVQLTVEAPGFETQIANASFDEEDDRDDRDITLAGGVAPTPTNTVGEPTPTSTPEPAPTAIHPAADINGDKIINHQDLLLLLQNWFHVVP